MAGWTFEQTQNAKHERHRDVNMQSRSRVTEVAGCTFEQMQNAKHERHRDVNMQLPHKLENDIHMCVHCL